MLFRSLPDPMSTLALCMRLLAPDGMLLIETPHVNDEKTFEAMQASGARFLNELRPIEHMYLFSEPALRLLLERLGCQWVPSVHSEQALFGYKRNQFLVAGRQPLPEQPPATIAKGLSTSIDGRMVQGLLDLKHYLEQARSQLSANRTRAAEKLKLVRLSLSNLSIQNDAITIGQGWYPVESYMQQTFRWVANDAQLIIRTPTGTRRTMSLDIEPGPGVGLQPFTLHVLDEQGRTAAVAEVKGREIVQITLPIIQGQEAVFRLHVEGGGLPTPNDPRILNFRVFRYWMQ